MKKIRLTAIEDDIDDINADEGLSFEFDLTPYVITCAMACVLMFITRLVRKHVFHEDLFKKYH